MYEIIIIIFSLSLTHSAQRYDLLMNSEYDNVLTESIQTEIYGSMVSNSSFSIIIIGGGGGNDLREKRFCVV